MKKSLVTLFALWSLFLYSGPAWSLTIGTDPNKVNVGSLDQWLASGALSDSGDATELSWVKSQLLALGLDNNVIMTAKTTTEDGAGWIQTNEQATAYAFDFKGDPTDYFLIKTGNLDSNKDDQETDLDTFLFRNDPSEMWAVVDLLSSVPDITLVNIGKFSHIDEFRGTAVPEPSTLLLLGFGLTGLYGYRLRKRRQG